MRKYRTLLILLGILLGLSVADTVSTIYGVNTGYFELNPVVSYMLGLGLWVFILFKVTSCAVAIALLWSSRDNPYTTTIAGLIIVFTSIVVVNNVLLIASHP